eukprot:6061376-Alexandrium_andersonii.AAC.1
MCIRDSVCACPRPPGHHTKGGGKDATEKRSKDKGKKTTERDKERTPTATSTSPGTSATAPAATPEVAG